MDLAASPQDRRMGAEVGSGAWFNARRQSYGEMKAGYRARLAQLPPKTAAQIAHGNARALFGGER